jgi:hypothetical protein
MAAKGLFAAALVETALVVWRDVSVAKVPPPPSDFVAVAIIYGGLSILPDSSGNFPALVGWGFVAATFLNLWSPSTPTKLAVPGGTANVASVSQQASGTKTTITPAAAATSQGS